MHQANGAAMARENEARLSRGRSDGGARHHGRGRHNLDELGRGSRTVRRPRRGHGTPNRMWLPVEAATRAGRNQRPERGSWDTKPQGEDAREAWGQKKTKEKRGEQRKEIKQREIVEEGATQQTRATSNTNKNHREINRKKKNMFRQWKQGFISHRNNFTPYKIVWGWLSNIALKRGGSERWCLPLSLVATVTPTNTQLFIGDMTTAPGCLQDLNKQTLPTSLAIFPRSSRDLSVSSVRPPSNPLIDFPITSLQGQLPPSVESPMLHPDCLTISVHLHLVQQTYRLCLPLAQCLPGFASLTFLLHLELPQLRRSPPSPRLNILNSIDYIEQPPPLFLLFSVLMCFLQIAWKPLLPSNGFSHYQKCGYLPPLIPKCQLLAPMALPSSIGILVDSSKHPGRPTTLSSRWSILGEVLLLWFATTRHICHGEVLHLWSATTRRFFVPLVALPDIVTRPCQRFG
eukprot:Gb_28568 [translate_table: standard]